MPLETYGTSSLFHKESAVYQVFFFHHFCVSNINEVSISSCMVIVPMKCDKIKF